MIILPAVAFAQQFETGIGASTASFDRFANWDGRDYLAIATDGYWHEPDVRSPVVFFPAYPLAGRCVMQATGLDATAALLLVAHLALLGAMLAFVVYLECGAPVADSNGWALAALALWPTTVFFRMAHTESLFLLLLIVALLGMRQGWRPVWIALVIGVATATRAPGIALLPVFALYLWQRATANTETGEGPSRSLRSRLNGRARFWCLVHVAWLLPLASWGLLAYMAFLFTQFGDPLLFARAQDARFLTTPADRWEQFTALITLEPLRAVYDPASDAYWASDARPPTIHNPAFSLHFANPIYFLLCAGLVAVGWWKKWLDAREALLGALLLLIPYVALGYQNWMISQGRFASVVFPAYIVMGRVLQRLPVAVSACLLGLCAWYLGVYAALFAAGYRIY